jgi:glycosyltransferase involved in cell wall biosynthesis
MKVLHIIESLGVGGAETLLLNLLPELQRQGDEVTLAVVRGPFDLREALEAQGVHVVAWRGRHKWNLPGTAGDLARLVRQHSVDVVHAHLYFPAVTTALSRVLRLHRAACVVSFHNLAYAKGVNKPGAGLRFRKVLAGWLYPRGFDAMLAVSQAVAKHYRSELGLKRVDVLHNPVALPLLERATPEGVPTAAGSAPAHLLVPGRLVHEKGHADLLQALVLLRDQGCDLRVTFAGHGPLREPLQASLQALGLSKVVTITGMVSHGHMLGAMAAADLVVVPSRFEGFGLTALEAMALGRPVVATTAGGLPEVIEHGVSGWLVPPQQPEALAQAIAMLLDNAALRQTLGAAGRARAQEQFSLPVIAAQLRSIYQGVCAARETASARS